MIHENLKMPNQHAVDTYPTFPVNHRYFLSLTKRNEPGTSSTLNLLYHEDSEYGDEKRAQKSRLEKALYFPNLYVLTNDEHWTMTPETHKNAAAAGSFCFSMTENREQQDICNFIIMPCVQRSLCPNGADQRFRQHES